MHPEEKVDTIVIDYVKLLSVITVFTDFFVTFFTVTTFGAEESEDSPKFSLFFVF